MRAPQSRLQHCCRTWVGEGKEVVLLLLTLGAEPDEDNYEGETAVTYALYGKHYETLFCLLESKNEAVGARRRAGQHTVMSTAWNDCLMTASL